MAEQKRYGLALQRFEDLFCVRNSNTTCLSRLSLIRDDRQSVKLNSHVVLFSTKRGVISATSFHMSGEEQSFSKVSNI